MIKKIKNENPKSKRIIHKALCFVLAFFTALCAFPLGEVNVSHAENGGDRNYALGATYEYRSGTGGFFCDGYEDASSNLLNDGEIVYEETKGKTMMVDTGWFELTFDLGKVYNDVYRIDFCGVMDMWTYNLSNARDQRTFSKTNTEISISENGVDYTNLEDYSQWKSENHPVGGVRSPYFNHMYQFHFKRAVRYVKIKCISAGTDYISLSEIRIMGTDTLIGVSGTLYNDIKWELLENGNLDITGKGEITNTFCNLHGDKVKNITVSQGITSIKNNAFKYFVNTENIWLADSVTELGDGTFKFFKSLKNARLSPKMITIPDQLFLGCESLVWVDLPKGIKDIGGSAFSGCKSLENIVLPEGLKVIGAGAFFECASLKTINLPESLISVKGAFFLSGVYGNEDYWDDGALYVDNVLLYGKKGLSGEFVVKPSTRIIAGRAFGSQTSLKKVVIPHGVKYICDSAFEECSALTSVYIPNTVTAIERRVFMGCESLKNLIIPSSVEMVGEYALGYKAPGALVKDFSINGAVGSIVDDYAWDSGIPFNKFPLTEIPESDYYVDSNSMSMNNIKEKTSISQLKADVLDVVGVYDKNGKAVSSGYLSTGFTVEASSGDKYTVIIKGDVDGSGSIDSTDYLQIKKMFLGELSLENEFFAAADTDKSGELTSTDYLKIKKYLLSESVI